MYNLPVVSPAIMTEKAILIFKDTASKQMLIHEDGDLTMAFKGISVKLETDHKLKGQRLQTPHT